MSSLNFEVNPATAVARVLIYNAKILIDPVYKYYLPQNGILSDSNETLTCNFTNVPTDYFIKYMAVLINQMFNDEMITVPRNVKVATDKPTNEHDFYLGFLPASVWMVTTNQEQYYCYNSSYNAAIWEFSGTTVKSFSYAIPNATNIVVPANSDATITQWSIASDSSLYNTTGFPLALGVLSPNQLGAYRVSLIFQIEQIVNLQTSVQIQFIRNGTDIIRRLNTGVQLSSITALNAMFQINGTFNFNHINLTDTYTVVISNLSSTGLNYNVSLYSLYNYSLEFLG